METVLALLSGFLLALAAILKAISPIVTTAIAETHKTERAKIKLSRNNQADSDALDETSITSVARDSAKRRRIEGLIGLLSVSIASGQIAVLYFGQDSASPLTVGFTAFIAQALVMYAVGWMYLARR